MLTLEEFKLLIKRLMWCGVAVADTLRDRLIAFLRLGIKDEQIASNEDKFINPSCFLPLRFISSMQTVAGPGD